MITPASESPYNDLAPIRTGTLIDKLSGIGGIPRKRLTEIYGDYGVGKSSVCLQSVASAQASGLRCLWVDLEYAYDARYAASLGVDNDRLGLLQTRYAEDALDEVERAIDAGEYDLVFIDSVGAIHSRTEAEKAAGEKTIGTQAGLMARFCRKITPLIAVRNVALVVINHAFTDIMSGKIMSSGGKKLEYHKSFSIRLKGTNRVLKSGERVIGKVIVGQVKKNKLASTEGMEVEAQIIFGEGFSASADLLDQALTAGSLTKRGNIFFFGEERIGMITKAREWIKIEENATRIRESLG